MNGVRDFNEFIEIGNAFAISLGENLREMLETKHLYQSYEVDSSKNKILASLNDAMENVDSPDDKSKIESILSSLRKCTWDLISPFTIARKENKVPFDYFSSVLRISLPTVKLYCSSQKCRRIEPYNPCLSAGYSSHIVMNYGYIQDTPEQLFVLEYECQSCKGTPTVFIIRRQGWKITITGRCPIEVVPVSGVFPKDFKKYISDAQIAHNSGQTLAGLFFLRTFIEQFTRSLYPGIEMADKVLEEYTKNLPEDFKSRFPSLSKIYADLSDKLHRADGSVEMFESGVKDLTEHFNARKLFKL